MGTSRLSHPSHSRNLSVATTTTTTTTFKTQLVFVVGMMILSPADVVSIRRPWSDLCPVLRAFRFPSLSLWRVPGRAAAPGYPQDEPEDDDECLDVIHLYLSPVWDIGHALFWPGEISAPAPRAIDELSYVSSVPIGPRASLFTLEIS